MNRDLSFFFFQECSFICLAELLASVVDQLWLSGTVPKVPLMLNPIHVHVTLNQLGKRNTRQANLPLRPLIAAGRGRQCAHGPVPLFMWHSLAKAFSFNVTLPWGLLEMTLLPSLRLDVPLRVAEVTRSHKLLDTKRRRFTNQENVIFAHTLKSRSAYCCFLSETYVMQKNDFPARRQPETDILPFL